ncbi:MAG: hypothetical protein Q4F67_01740 [Propionibacteriaceae bacterium]|nr:hypothetical protein [Propionibacteriaceae bacterium]
MSWILAIAVCPARTWAARAPLGPKTGAPELIRLGPGDPKPPADADDRRADAPAEEAHPAAPPATEPAADGPVLAEAAAPDPQVIRTEGMPSAVWSDGSVTLVGVEALDRAGIAPAGLVLDPYALLAAPADGGPDPIPLVSALLAAAYERAVAETGTPPERTLVTHPDGWSAEQVLDLRRAASLAGIGIIPVPEPIAVAAAYRGLGGEGGRLLMLDADRNTASAIARMGNLFLVLATTSAPDDAAADDVLPGLVEEVLTQPGVNRELLDEVLLTGEALPEGLSERVSDLLRRTPAELPSWVLAPGALHYDHSLHAVPPQPAPAPPPPPPPPPVPRVNHAAPVKGSRRLPLVPLLVLILVVLVLAELLFVYWPF